MATSASTTDTKQTYTWGTGRRKAAVCRVRIRPGSGEYLVNDRPVDEYFNLERDRQTVRAPLKLAQVAGRYDIFVNASGGGFMVPPQPRRNRR